jgi:hypothetical protein
MMAVSTAPPPPNNRARQGAALALTAPMV